MTKTLELVRTVEFLTRLKQARSLLRRVGQVGQEFDTSMLINEKERISYRGTFNGLALALDDLKGKTDERVKLVAITLLKKYQYPSTEGPHETHRLWIELYNWANQNSFMFEALVDLVDRMQDLENILDLEKPRDQVSRYLLFKLGV